MQFVAMFFPLFIHATPEETGPKGTGMVVPAFEHEGMSQPERLCTDIPVGHALINIEPFRRAQVFDTREEAEEWVRSQTVRRSGWQVLPVQGPRGT